MAWMSDESIQSVTKCQRPRRFAFRALCLSFGVLSGLAVAEVVVRAFDVGPRLNIVYRRSFRLSDNPVLKYELMPGSKDGRSTISRAGLRDREFSIKKPDGVYRIVVIGDSVTYGLWCRRRHTYPKQLEAMLNAAGSNGLRFEVLNLGVSGYNTTQAVEALRVRGLQYQPDLVVYGYVLNDPQSYSLEEEGLKALTAQTRRDISRRLARGVLRALSHSRLFHLAYASLAEPAVRLEDALEDPTYKADKLGSRQDYIRALHETEVSWRRVTSGFAELGRIAADANGPAVLIAIFPLEEPGAGEDYPLRDVHDRVASAASQYGLATLDLLRPYTLARALNGPELYGDFLHPTEAGHRVAALSLVKWLAESGNVPTGSIDLGRLRSIEGFDAIAAALLEMKSE